MPNFINHQELVSLVSFMDTYERLAKQQQDFQQLPESSNKQLLLSASELVLEQVALQLENRLDKCKKDQETHAKAEKAGIIIQSNLPGPGLVLPSKS
jgi:hypothetical protein